MHEVSAFYGSICELKWAVETSANGVASCNSIMWVAGISAALFILAELIN